LFGVPSRRSHGWFGCREFLCDELEFPLTLSSRFSRVSFPEGFDKSGDCSLSAPSFSAILPPGRCKISELVFLPRTTTYFSSFDLYLRPSPPRAPFAGRSVAHIVLSSVDKRPALFRLFFQPGPFCQASFCLLSGSRCDSGRIY